MKRNVDIGQAVIGIIGVLGTLTCIGAMMLAAVGVADVGASAAMAGMGAQGSASCGQPTSIPAFLLVSIGAFALSLATRRWVAAIQCYSSVASSTGACTVSLACL